MSPCRGHYCAVIDAMRGSSTPESRVACCEFVRAFEVRFATEKLGTLSSEEAMLSKKRVPRLLK